MAPVDQDRTPPTIRLLPAEEWERLRAFEPFATQGLPNQPKHWAIVVAEVEGQIIGFWGMHDAIHIDPLWIHEAHRARASVFRPMFAQLITFLQEAGVGLVFGHVEPEVARANGALMKHLGFYKLEQIPYALEIPEKKE